VNGTLLADGNWTSPNFTTFDISTQWSCNVTAYDGTNFLTNSTSFTVAGASPPEISSISTNKGLSFMLSAVNDTYCYATVTDPDGNDTIQWVNFTVKNPSGIEVFSNVNGSILSGQVWNSQNFTPSATGYWTCIVRAYDGISQPVSQVQFEVTSSSSPPTGGGGGSPTPPIVQEEEEEPFTLPALQGEETLLKAILAVGIVFVILDQFVFNKR